MDNPKLRKDRTCKNCKHVVDKRFCSNCGQENTETRQSFAHLVAHFAEDFTHYDNGFWRTIKYLLTRPGRLTSEYIAGRRNAYVSPVKLYIFISFLAFFLLSVLATPQNTDDDIVKIKSDAPESEQIITDYKSVAEYDSIEKSLPEHKRMSKIETYFTRKMLTIDQKYTFDEFRDELIASVMANLPKVLFLFMPLSAFCLWLFHGKKRWFYFDHGIFTLHYFSFILLTFSAYLLLHRVMVMIPGLDNFPNLLIFLMLGWWFFYFFRSHRRFYGESKLISRSKSLALFFINLFFIIIFLVGLFIYSMVNIH